MVAEALGETQDGVAADLTQPGRAADAAAVGEVLGDGHEFAFGGSQAEQGRVGALGEVRAAGDTVQAADAVPAAGPAVQAQATGAALGVGGAVGVGAGQVCVVGGAHRFPSSSWASLILCSQGRPAKPYGATTRGRGCRWTTPALFAPGEAVRASSR